MKPAPNKVESMRTDTTRLHELISQCSRLNTHDVPLLCQSATEVWSYARSLALEIGLDLKNPPIPAVMCSTVKNCPPLGEHQGRCKECSGGKG